MESVSIEGITLNRRAEAGMFVVVVAVAVEEDLRGVGSRWVQLVVEWGGGRQRLEAGMGRGGRRGEC